MAEKWRDRLLAEPDAAGLFLNEFRDVDGARLRLLIEKAHAEHKGGRAPKHARELFHFVNDLVQAHGRPS